MSAAECVPRLVSQEALPLSRSLKFSLILVLSISTMHVFWGYPLPSSKVSGKPDSFLTLLNSCPTRMERREGLDFLKPVLEKTFMKRSFRNGLSPWELPPLTSGGGVVPARRQLMGDGAPVPLGGASSERLSGGRSGALVLLGWTQMQAAGGMRSGSGWAWDQGAPGKEQQEQERQAASPDAFGSMCWRRQNHMKSMTLASEENAMAFAGGAWGCWLRPFGGRQ
ncbi:hypothetical protein MC885_002079 [Smutsia gigantea]|nr:hypothetical protein MC885_002079 [Smutsia gigantea]